jgi:DNA-binding NarL/FixJ family response regulator
MTIAAIETRRTNPRPATSQAGGVASDPRRRPVGVLIVDDDRESSYSLWALLRWQPGIRVRAATHRGSDAIAEVHPERPAVCLVSAAAGPRCVHRLTQLADGPRVLVYANRRTVELDATAVLAGADGVLWRYADGDELAGTIRRVAAGQGRPPALTPEAIHALIDRVDDRDRLIAAMLLEHAPLDEIARTVGISASSLRARRRDMLRRLDDTVRTAPAAVDGDPDLPSVSAGRMSGGR